MEKGELAVVHVQQKLWSKRGDSIFLIYWKGLSSEYGEEG
uniref:Chromo domain-containing protein n=1 Tax=Anguilla anguilla TaxID=7936 RepID=A0A0E9W530_ANGAN